MSSGRRGGGGDGHRGGQRGRGRDGLRGRGQRESTRGGRGGTGVGGQRGGANNHVAPVTTAEKSPEGLAARFDRMQTERKAARQDFINRGLMEDPDKPRRLADAITLVGTCQDMCAEYERVERAVQKDVWREEMGPNREPDERRMVKKFRRAAAGMEEQLPSDLRPPAVLQRTCDYLFDEIVARQPLDKVHHFVWDRTRAIRNDFSIQQIAKPDHVRIAVDCFERIARFHIMALHELAATPQAYEQYNAQQERDQLEFTLLSLFQYYSDHSHHIDFPHEPEFRAYSILFQLRAPITDLEYKVQTWPLHVLSDPRVRVALDIYAAIYNTMDSHGPFQPTEPHPIAQQDFERAWRLLESSKTTFTMACAAEVHFQLIRRTALNAIWVAFRARPKKSPEDWTIPVLLRRLRLDTPEQVRTFCGAYQFHFATSESGVEYLDLTSVSGKYFPSPFASLSQQWRSELVERKRLGLSTTDAIRGLGSAAPPETPRNHAVEVERKAEVEVAEDIESEDESSLFMPVDGPKLPSPELPTPRRYIFSPEASFQTPRPFMYQDDTPVEPQMPTFLPQKGLVTETSNAASPKPAIFKVEPFKPGIFKPNIPEPEPPKLGLLKFDPPKLDLFKFEAPRSESQKPELLKSEPKGLGLSRPTTSIQDPPKIKPDAPSFNDTLMRIARELTETQPGVRQGWLDQFIEFTVQQHILEINQQVGMEKAEVLAQQHRILHLAQKYVTLWRVKARRRKRRRRTSQYRENQLRRLRESRARQTDTQNTSSPEVLTECKKPVIANRTEPVAGMKRSATHHDQPQPVVKRQRSNDIQPYPPPPGPPTPPECPPSPKHSLSSLQGLSIRTRAPSTERRVEPEPDPDPDAELLRKSAYLGFRNPKGSNSPRPTARRSMYFIWKAWGVEPPT
ncbi:hypothetical protein K470DRAFT_260082 [Piedraia hortae CBS 480.64]|uniref:SAC3/GANP/THP3 conserved domain-containing protein n=1 Tax=Piedraia hortae CBS 480.64 TaxID=1314780 RepID=A0A6A7BSE6_9PEZI|nr:hypothetical protein K470DRAFT_260082 [Piedraia hortae CBS 480.64]